MGFRIRLVLPVMLVDIGDDTSQSDLCVCTEFCGHIHIYIRTFVHTLSPDKDTISIVVTIVLSALSVLSVVCMCIYVHTMPYILYMFISLYLMYW